MSGTESTIPASFPYLVYMRGPLHGARLGSHSVSSHPDGVAQSHTMIGRFLKLLRDIERDAATFRTPVASRDLHWFVDQCIAQNKHCCAELKTHRLLRDISDPDLEAPVVTATAVRLTEGRTRVLRHRSRAEVLSYFVSLAPWIANHAHEKHIRELLNGDAWASQTASLLRKLAAASARDPDLRFGKNPALTRGIDTERRRFEEEFKARISAISKKKRRIREAGTIPCHCRPHAYTPNPVASA
jgi:hypothetical protein